ncbi:MAG: hypothetical protein P1U30_09460 [Phycisphaerales bacterium]|nr:hypothetical protein [Phycisphaerales bacterium]
MKISNTKNVASWICLLSFVIHAALHINSVFSQNQPHFHTTTNQHFYHTNLNSTHHDLAPHPSNFEQHHNEHHDTDHEYPQKNDDHDPTHHLKIQYRVTNQTYPLATFANLHQQRVLCLSNQRHTIIVQDQSDEPNDLSYFLNNIKLIL